MGRQAPHWGGWWEKAVAMEGARLAPDTPVSAAGNPSTLGVGSCRGAGQRSQPSHFCQPALQLDKFGATENNKLSIVCVTIH